MYLCVYVCIHICLYALLHAWMHNLPSACVGVCVQQGAYAAVVPVRNLTCAPPHTIWSISDTLSISASAWTDVGYSLHVSLKWGLGMTWTSRHTIPSIGDMWSPLDLLVINQLDVRSWLHNLVYQRRALLFVVVRGHIAAWHYLELRMCHVSLVCQSHLPHDKTVEASSGACPVLQTYSTWMLWQQIAPSMLNIFWRTV